MLGLVTNNVIVVSPDHKISIKPRDSEMILIRHHFEQDILFNQCFISEGFKEKKPETHEDIIDQNHKMTVLCKSNILKPTKKDQNKERS